MFTPRHSIFASLVRQMQIVCISGVFLGACRNISSVSPVKQPKFAAPSPTSEFSSVEVVRSSNFSASQASTHQELRNIQRRIDQFVPTPITADLSHLSQSQRKVLALLIDASKFIDPVFDRQVSFRNPSIRSELEASQTPLATAKLRYFEIMRGPWDRQDHQFPFATNRSKPPGAGFYPPDLRPEQLQKYIKTFPEQQVALTSPTTIVERVNDRLQPRPYSEAFAAWLKPAADKLRQAAAMSDNKSLSRFLVARADSLTNDDYYLSEKAWMDVDGPIEITIGPYETYEDELLGLKTAFESFVTVIDPKASDELKRFKSQLPAMENNLPIPEVMRTMRGSQSPIRVADLVFSAGDARKSIQTIAFNLPNDEKVRKEKGAKKVLLRNLIKAKFSKILRPLADKLLIEDQIHLLSTDAFFYEVLFHELSHSLGPAYTSNSNKKLDIRSALGPNYSPIEEAKADVMGAYNILFMIEQNELPSSLRNPLLVSYFIGLIRSVRFGVNEAHGRGAAIQINRFLAEKAATFDELTGQFSVNLQQLPTSISTLVGEICALQARGNAKEAREWLGTLGRNSPAIQIAISRLSDIPLDILPIYPLAGE